MFQMLHWYRYTLHFFYKVWSYWLVYFFVKVLKTLTLPMIIFRVTFINKVIQYISCCADFVQIKIKLLYVFKIKLYIKHFITKTNKNLKKIFFISFLVIFSYHFYEGNYNWTAHHVTLAHSWGVTKGFGNNWGIVFQKSYWYNL